MKSKRSRATDISARTKAIVWERDGQRCIFCGSHAAMPNAHYISRAQGGLGVEKNIVTACGACHYEMDNTPERPVFLEKAKNHLMSCYIGWNESELVYKKG